MRRPRWRRQAEQIRPSAGFSLAPDQIPGRGATPRDLGPVITIAFSEGQKAAGQACAQR